MEDKAQVRAEDLLVQERIQKDWKKVAKEYPHLINDFKQFYEGLRDFFRHCAEEQEMYGVSLDDHRINQALQQARICDTVGTYITSRIDEDVAQPIKN